jgi:asparagine N-glycosylation enzyme membrane subunit Stt3
VPPQTNDKVWISREEYDRLREADKTPALPHYPTHGMQSNPYDVPPSTAPLSVMQRQLLIVSTVLGVVFVLSLSVSVLHWLVAPIVVIFLIFAVVSLVQYNRAKAHIARGEAVKQPRSTARLLFLIAGGVLLLPFAFAGTMIVLFIIFMSLNGGQGS